MALVLRTVVGRPLTWTEGDDNLTYLEGLVPTPGGAVGEIQYNDNGAFNGVADLTYSSSLLRATGSFTGSFVGELSGTASYATTASYVQNALSASYATTASYALNAPTASYVSLVAGPGITVNGLEITASVRSVNGSFPTNGNVQASLTATVTGLSASLQASGSGTVTASLQDGLVWVVTGETGPASASNGEVYIYHSASVGEWFPVAPSDQAGNDARYLMLTPQSPLAGALDLGTNNITNGNLIGTASWAESTVSSSYPVTVAGSTLRSVNPVGGNGASTVNSVFLGGLAGDLAASANYSVFIGSEAGNAAEYASNSNFIGHGAGSQANTGSNSNMMGYYAGAQTENTDNSNFFGQNAGRQATQAHHSNFFGQVAGFQAFSASYSNFIGYYAGIYASAAPKSNFIGYQAGQSATNAYNSNFIGVNAGDGATNADKSNFIGHRAGDGATDALRSNFIGRYAGYQATNAQYSNFMGNEAGYQATDALFSNFIGNGAGYLAYSASQSNFIGSVAGYQATNAINSNFMSNNAGQFATNASQSNFLGLEAGYQATDAHNSNFFGYLAGSSATSASYSTLIGYRAGNNAAGGALGVKSNNIIIGTNITLADGAQDSINLGGIIFATGSYSNPAGNPYSGSAGGRVGINVVSPTSTLDILGSFNVTGTATLTSASVVGDMITNVGDTYTTPAVIKIVTLTSGEYTSLSPNYDANTLYVVI